MIGGRTWPAQFLVEMSDRELDWNLEVTSHTTDTVRVASDHGFAFAPMDDLQKDGWGRIEDGATTRFYGPSPEALLSSWFGANHCLSLADERDAESNFGLAFESIGESLAIGMEGVFWIDPSSWHLRRIDFHFTGSRDLRRAPEQGGSIELAVDRNKTA